MKSNVEALLAGSFDDDVPTQRPKEFGFGSRSSTPSIPPGFENTHAHPTPSARDDLNARSPSKMIATSAEFTPGRVRAGTPLSQVSLPSSPVQTFVKPTVTASTQQARVDTKALASSSGLSKEIAAQASKGALQTADFPALDSTKPKTKTTKDSPVRSTVSPALPTITNKKIPGGALGNMQPSAKGADKKDVSNLISISAPQKQASKAPLATESPSKPIVNPAEFPALTPSAAQPTAAKHTPKTLKISAPTKQEVQVTTPLVTPSSTSSSFLPQGMTSRQPTIAAVAKIEGSSTPTSEAMPDNISLTDTSMSRANSPPPTRIGSAPVRENTKSMQKKARVQRAKEKAEQEAAAAASAKHEPEIVEVAPVMGRKKKQKKDRTVSSMTARTAASTPTVSRAPSPGPAVKEIQTESKEGHEDDIKAPEKSAPETATNPRVVQPVDAKGKGKAKNQPVPTPVQELVATAEPYEEDLTTEKTFPTPATILQQLVADGDIPSVDTLGLLKPLSSASKSQDAALDIQTAATQKLSITPEDRVALLAGQAVHKVADGHSRTMLTPNGDCVRNLTEDEEKRYLELQARIASEAGPATFISSKYHSGNGFTLIGGRAVPNGLPSFFPNAITNAPSMDPVSKIQRDEALSYINQYVLPSLSSNTQLEKALNANSLDKTLLQSPIDVSNWAQWSHDILPPSSSSHPETSVPSGTPNPESMLGLESITAHFAVASGLSSNASIGGGIFAGGSGGMGMLSATEAESALQLARKEAEGLEKRFNTLLKKNRKLLLGSGH